MSWQDYTSFTVVDGAVRFSAAANVLTIANLDNDEAYYVYKDFGAAYFAADFESFFRFKFTLGTGAESIYLAAYANGVGAISALVAASGDALWLAWDNGVLTLAESNGGSVTSGSLTALSLNTEYFVRLARDENVGTFGTLYLYVYSDRQMTDLIASTSVALTKKTDFRYLYAASGKSTGAGGTALSGTISYLDLTANPHTRKRLREDFKEIINPNSDTATSDVGLVSDAEINQWLLDAVVDIAIKTGCDQDIDTGSTTNAQRFVSFTGIRPLFVEYSSLALMQIKEAAAGHEQTGGTTPSQWFQRQNQIGIEPLPDGTYSLNLYVCDYGGTEMSADYDTPLIPPAFRDIIFWNLMVRAMTKLKRTALAAHFFAIYTMELKEALELDVQPEVIEAYGDKRIPDFTYVAEE